MVKFWFDAYVDISLLNNDAYLLGSWKYEHAFTDGTKITKWLYDKIVIQNNFDKWPCDNLRSNDGNGPFNGNKLVFGERVLNMVMADIAVNHKSNNVYFDNIKWVYDPNEINEDEEFFYPVYSNMSVTGSWDTIIDVIYRSNDQEHIPMDNNNVHPFVKQAIRDKRCKVLVVAPFESGDTIYDDSFLLNNIMKLLDCDRTDIVLVSGDTSIGTETSNTTDHGMYGAVIPYPLFNDLIKVTRQALHHAPKHDTINDNVLTKIKPYKFLFYGGKARFHRQLMMFMLLHTDLISQGLVSIASPIGSYDNDREKYLLSVTLNKIFPDIHEDTISNEIDLLYNLIASNHGRGLELYRRTDQNYEWVYDECDFINTYFSIVTETFELKNIPWVRTPREKYKEYILKNEVFLTGKTFKCIALKHPFILSGHPHSLKALRDNFGFKTFAPFINEDYDSIEDPVERNKALIKEIKRLCSMSVIELAQWSKAIQPILEYNYNHFYNRPMSVINTVKAIGSYFN